jgi:UDP-4-amino-4,6-dideoxy-N-acetyl-beta-L-altrosamine transaminase
MIPYARQDICDEDIQSVVDVLKSDFLTQGPVINAFEDALSEYAGARYSVCVNSATSALHLSCLALGLGPGDILWTSAITYVASANCAFYCGAQVDLIDIELQSFNLSVSDLERKLIDAKKKNRLPKILVAVHMAGQPCDMEAIRKLTNEYGVAVIEDASHAIGASYGAKKVGSCQYSDITVFSFHPVKIITAGEGGAALTNDETLAKKIELLRSHGVTRDPDLMAKSSDGPWYYEQIALGMNYRMTDIHAALGNSQLKRIDGFVERRNQISSCYSEAFHSLGVKTPKLNERCQSAWHIYIARLELDALKLNRFDFFNKMKDSGLGVNVHYIPLYRQPYIKDHMEFQLSNYPNAEQYYAEAITLPLYPSMSDAEIDTVISIVSGVLKEYAV